ncbi:unnamed protein product [Cuscuta campestris]|uniref:Uncharacterized protein n=1 Tax=Cuscuta campestris TaxID=132261 RepID=A0A484N3A8_9ASTE|nr:unnamed protein product [Cuscuta campestris]
MSFSSSSSWQIRHSRTPPPQNPSQEASTATSGGATAAILGKQECVTSKPVKMAERSKAPVSGTGPKGRGFKSHS